MKYFYILFIVGLLLIHTAQAQQLERITNSLPVFAASSNISAANGILTIGVFSDASTVNQNNLELIRTLKTWNSKLIKKAIPHKKIEVTALDDTNIAEFKGQIIWVIDGDSFSLEKIKIHTNNGVFTIGTQELAFENYLFATLIQENSASMRISEPLFGLTLRAL
ncbi:MAG: hypothetical protein B6244_06875 [Candidatus Cloacimonetes bacterium 4572_55]|nr:MAG: hypothetical protein B6244_06875 [Candidatus Cloacimonetes bacterium 4572_55]